MGPKIKIGSSDKLDLPQISFSSLTTRKKLSSFFLLKEFSEKRPKILMLLS